MLKKIVEDKNFKDKYWPDFKIKNDVNDYKPIILKHNNRYLHALLQLINSDEQTSTIKYKQIIRIFELV